LTTIRFHLAEDAIERVGFAYCPRLEAVFSLHVLVEPQRHPLHHGWIRRMRSLPRTLRRELTACAFAFGAAPPRLGTALPDPLTSLPSDADGGPETFEDGLAAARALGDGAIRPGSPTFCASATTPCRRRHDRHWPRPTTIRGPSTNGSAR
jgi:hypothetical protein